MKQHVQVSLAIAMLAAIATASVLVWLGTRTAPTITITSPETTSIQVHVDGAVVDEGVVTLPVGARLVDVIDAAGGSSDDADLSNLNLAGRVGDGEHVTIPTQTEARVGEPLGQPVTTEDDTLLDINTATVQQLVELPGIGDVLAARIVAYRDAHGPYMSIDDLAAVDGISAGLIEKLRPFITVTPGG